MDEKEDVKDILRANEEGEILGHTFRNTEFLIRAFTRAAFAKEWRDSGNEPIEHQRPVATLGDAILKAALADSIFNSGRKSADQITKEKIKRERNSTIAKVNEKCGLWRLTRLGGSEKEKHLEREPSILATTIEAVIGAIYLDTGCDFLRTKEVIAQWF